VIVNTSAIAGIAFPGISPSRVNMPSWGHERQRWTMPSRHSDTVNPALLRLSCLLVALTGWHHTDDFIMVPGRIDRQREIAQTVVFSALMLPAITGQPLAIDGGFTVS